MPPTAVPGQPSRGSDLAASTLVPVALLAAALGWLLGVPARPLLAVAALAGAALLAGTRRLPRVRPGVTLATATAAAFLAGRLDGGGAWWAALVLAAGLAALGLEAVAAAARMRALDEERAQLARQVDRRISEIFSLQELSYVLAESLHSERIASQVVRYVSRFLGADGAAVALMQEEGSRLMVAAAEGSLAEFTGRRITDDPPSLMRRAMTTERIEVTPPGSGELLLPGLPVAAGAAAPLRAHGLTMGVVAVAAGRPTGFTAEDLWLLSTVATHAAVVLANSRLFEMVRQAKEDWETAFNALTEGMAVLDTRGRVNRGNAALARLLGLSGRELLGRPFWATVVGEDRNEDAVVGAAGRGERPPPLTLRSSRLDRELRLTAAPLAESADHAAVVVLVEDVTEQRALEAQLIQSEKLAAVGQLVSGLAHELNNPLTSIAGLAEFLEERGGVAAADREHLRVIHEQAERAGRIVRNLLTFARKGSPGKEPVDLGDVVQRTVLLVSYELHLRGITLQEERHAEPLPVRGNRDELQQVLLNLITNAVQAVRDLPSGRPRRITLATEREREHATVRIRDTGPGIASDLAPQIFTPFFTTKDPGEGTGLGLSLSFRIVEAHGGRMGYRAGPEGGAEFWFELPLAGGEARQRVTPPTPAAGTRAALVIDGDPGSELVVRALLEPAGYLVEAVRQGTEAPERIASRPWALVVVDGGLSADGRRLLVDQLAEEPAAAGRVVVTTGDPAQAERCRGLGQSVLPRPFLPRDLAVAVADLLSG